MIHIIWFIWYEPYFWITKWALKWSILHSSTTGTIPLLVLFILKGSPIFGLVYPILKLKSGLGFHILHHCQCSAGPVKWTDQRILANIGDGEKSDFNFIDIKRMIPLENTLIIRAQIAYYIDSEDTLIGTLSLYSFILTYSLCDIGHSLSHRIPT